MRDDDCDKVLQIQLDFEFKHVPKLYGKKKEGWDRPLRPLKEISTLAINLYQQTDWLAANTPQPKVNHSQRRRIWQWKLQKLKCADRTVPSPQHCNPFTITEPEELAGQLRNGSTCEDYLKWLRKGVMIREKLGSEQKKQDFVACLGFFPCSEYRKWNKEKENIATLERKLNSPYSTHYCRLLRKCNP